MTPWPIRWLVLAGGLAALPLQGSEPWVYQIQDSAPAALASAGFSRTVIDFSADGTREGEFSPAEIAALQKSGVQSLAYFSIGEAEDYRFYFDPKWKTAAGKPAWLGRENPDWPGNYKVRYWDPAWRDGVLAPYLERIVAQGHDGLYLDIVDAFEYWGNPDTYGPQEPRRPGDPADEAEAAARMIDLVEWIGARAKERRGGPVAVYPQNGERLLGYDPAGRYLAAVAGFGVEDLWFDGTRRQPAGETNHRLPFLRAARAAGKRILSVEYVDQDGTLDGANGARIREFLALARAEGFDFYAARSDRELNLINALPGVQP